MTNRNTLWRALGALALAQAAMAAQAQILAPGTTIPVFGTTLAASPSLDGTVVQDRTRTFSFASATGSVTGQLEDRVVKADDGTFDFYWRISVDAGSTGRVFDLYLSNFTDELAHALVANYRLDGVGTVPVKAAARSADGSQITFDFSDGPAAGQTTYLLFLDTQATHYADTAFAKLGGTDGGISPALSTWSASPVPEAPASALMLAGGAALALLRRATRRR